VIKHLRRRLARQIIVPELELMQVTSSGHAAGAIARPPSRLARPGVDSCTISCPYRYLSRYLVLRVLGEDSGYSRKITTASTFISSCTTSLEGPDPG